MTTRSRWLLPVLVVLLVTVPILEVWLLIQVGQVIGVGPTLAILVAEALVGGWLMRREGSRAWLALVEAFQRGRMPVTELTNAALVLVGGVLLLLPGFATDVVGLICLLPFTRPLVRRVLSAIVVRRVKQLGMAALRPRQSGDLIPGEVVEPDQPSPERRTRRGELDGPG